MASINNSTNGSSVSSMTSQKGIGGLASGLDTDQLVKDLTTAERNRIAKQQQEIDALKWEQEGYREVIKKMQGFESKYFDLLSPTNLGSGTTFNSIKATSSGSAVSVRTDDGSYAGNITVDSITQLAKGMTLTASNVTASLKGSVDIASIMEQDKTVDPANISTTLMGKLVGRSMKITVDGTVKTITFDRAWMDKLYESGQRPDAEAFANSLQSKLDEAFGAGRISASIEDGSLALNAVSGSSAGIASIGTGTSPLDLLGFKNNQSNRISTTVELSSMADNFAEKLTSTMSKTEKVGSGENAKDYKYDVYKFAINGVNFEIRGDMSLKNIMNEINSSKAGVTLSYSNISDKFVMTSKELGAGSNIELSDYSGPDGSSNFLASLGLIGPNVDKAAGQSAIFSVDGQTLTRDTNTDIVINGAMLTLNEVTSEATKVSMTTDTSDMKTLIKDFVNDYNDMLDLVNKYYMASDEDEYKPLTEAQKEEMTDKEIEKWEEKGKSLALKNDMTLSNIATKLRTMMFTSYEGFSFYEMGIGTSSYKDYGKLSIDEKKLDSALSNNSEKIKSFFYGEKGFAKAMDGALKSAVKSTGPKSDRGILIQRAGIGSTTSDTENYISENIKRMQESLKTFQARLEDRESYWWSKFTSLEKIVNQMNSYSSMLAGFEA